MYIKNIHIYSCMLSLYLFLLSLSRSPYFFLSLSLSLQTLACFLSCSPAFFLSPSPSFSHSRSLSRSITLFFSRAHFPSLSLTSFPSPVFSSLSFSICFFGFFLSVCLASTPLDSKHAHIDIPKRTHIFTYRHKGMYRAAGNCVKGMHAHIDESCHNYERVALHTYTSCREWRANM